MTKIRIAFLGLGGVGGYYGGKLAARYSGSGRVEVCFFARGEHLKAIQETGIHIITDEEDFIARPDLATDNLRTPVWWIM